MRSNTLWHFFCSILSLSERHLISFFLTEHVSLSSALIGFQFHQDSTQLGHRLPACLFGLFEAIVHRCADRVLHHSQTVSIHLFLWYAISEKECKLEMSCNGCVMKCCYAECNWRLIKQKNKLIRERQCILIDYFIKPDIINCIVMKMCQTEIWIYGCCYHFHVMKQITAFSKPLL